MSSTTQPPTKLEKTFKVLCVEDQEFLRLMLADYLMHIGYVVETAADGIEGWHKFSNDTFDLVITDIEMPNLNGIGLIRRLRDSRQPVRIIVHSSALTASTLDELRKLSVDATIPKGSPVEALRATVELVTHLPA